ncbi:hypothetical protein BDL97_12G060400 [Sphagnum fallax]|nr:hypothetical protein BDL97_12G060400 [Sphagnum fallax]
MANSAAQSPSIISPMWMQPAGGESHCDSHNLGLSKTPVPGASGSLVPSFAPKTPCEENALMKNHHHYPLHQQQPSSAPGVVVTTVVVPDDKVRIPYRQPHKAGIGNAQREPAGKWVQEHYLALGAGERSDSPFFVYTAAGSERPMKRVKRRKKPVDPTKIAHEIMDKDMMEAARTNRNVVELDPSGVVDDVRSSNGFHGASTSDQVKAQVIDKVLAKILDMPIQESKAVASLPQEESRSWCNPNFHQRIILQKKKTEHNQQCSTTHGGGAVSSQILCPERSSSVSMMRIIPQQMAQLVADRINISAAGVSPRPTMQETTTGPGSLLTSRLTPPQEELQGTAADPGSCLFPPPRKLQGLLQETDSGSLLGMQKTPDLECLSGQRMMMMGSSMYSSPPLSIPTPNPVLKSTVGMMGCGSLRGKASAKACEEVSENRKESKPLLWSGSTLHAVPAYSPMSVSKQTVSTGEPSLLLTLNFSPMPPGSTGLSPKCSTVEEWGKMLGLSHTPATAATEVETSTTEHKLLLCYQERFIRLQAFLKKCDDDKQEDLLQTLQSLSAAARSGHAVKLETRAVGLSIAEGKEMSRVKMLNVMGRGLISRGRNDVGGTPMGPRLPALSTTLELGYQN